jgi:hypothetical protein
MGHFGPRLFREASWNARTCTTRATILCKSIASCANACAFPNPHVFTASLKSYMRVVVCIMVTHVDSQAATCAASRRPRHVERALATPRIRVQTEESACKARSVGSIWAIASHAKLCAGLTHLRRKEALVSQANDSASIEYHRAGLMALLCNRESKRHIDRPDAARRNDAVGASGRRTPRPCT